MSCNKKQKCPISTSNWFQRYMEIVERRHSFSRNWILCHSISSLEFRKTLCRLLTIAKCSSAQRQQDLNYSLHSKYELNEIDKPAESSEMNYQDRLPGYQQKEHGRSKVRQNATFSDMQVNNLIQEETGMDRLRAMYAFGSDWMFVQHDTRMLTTIFYRSVLLGFVLNVVRASQFESKKTKHAISSEVFLKKGMLSNSSKVLREAAKNTGRLSLYAASLIYLSQSIAAFRNVSSPWEYTMSAFVAMSVAGVGKPPRAYASSLLVSAGIGYLGGCLVCSMLSSAGASQEQRTLNRIREKLKQQQIQQQAENVNS